MLIELNAKIYPIEVILNTCYSFIDDAYIFLDLKPRTDYVQVYLRLNSANNSKRKKESLEGKFKNFLLQNLLRYKISKYNQKIRTYIVGRALFSILPASQMQGIGDNLDYRKDPLGIGVSWEKKHQKKKSGAAKI